MKFEIIVAVFGITFTTASLLALNPKTSSQSYENHAGVSRNLGNGEKRNASIDYPEETIVFTETT